MLKSSISFGDYLFEKYYFLKVIIFYLTLPINLIEGTLKYGGMGGFSGLVIFCALFAGVVRNPKAPYFVRFNACQSLLLNISLILITYFLAIFPLPIPALISFIFIAYFSIFIYSVFQCIYGIEPEIPLISKSVRMQI
tara:strand:- start:255 stop:668 length:414 start_codon:yes stop_codon:yes gene_type:complete